jgi:hypothetical protein
MISAIRQRWREATATGAPAGPVLIGAGFGRTGTTSLKRALDDLGIGLTYHGEDLIWRPADVRAWHAYAETGEADWTAMLGRFGAALDFPVACAWRDLADAFPDAKIILTVRDPEAWWASMASTVYPARTMFPAWWVAIQPTTRIYLDMTRRLIWDGLFDGRFEDREHAIKVYEHHVSDIIATIPPERLLVFDVAEGWEPLCEFLGVPVPDHPFPRVNDSRRMRRWITFFRIYSRVWPALAVVYWGGLAVAWRQHRRRRAVPTIR